MNIFYKLRLVNLPSLIRLRFVRRKICYLDVTLGFMLMIYALMSSNVDAAIRIENVEAEVNSENSLPPMVKERMEESVAAIGQQLILGHPLPMTENWRKQQEATIHMVFDKILVGYTVNRVDIYSEDTTATINVNLLPWSDTIENIKFNITVEGMPKDLEKLVIDDLASIDKVFSDG